MTEEMPVELEAPPPTPSEPPPALPVPFAEPGAPPPITEPGGAPAVVAIPDGIVHDAGMARSTPCICYELEDEPERELCFSHGVIGALSTKQQALFCDTKEIRPLSEAERANLTRFREAAHSCRTPASEQPKGERLGVFLTCMQRELKRQQAEQ